MVTTASSPVNASSISVENARSDVEARPVANFHPSPWGDYFLDFVPDDEVTQSQKEKEANELEQKMKEQLLQTANDKSVELIDLIDAIERLGVAHRFEVEIEHALHIIKQYMENHPLSFYHTSVCFRLLRQRGFSVSCDVFNAFQDEQGRFKDSLTNDVKGMLSLFETSFVAKHGDDILNEAREFTTTHLNTIAVQVPNHPLSEQLSRALYQPMFRGMPRLESRLFISYYEKDPCHNKSLLKLAKMDFNLVQALHKKELKELTRWWKDLDLITQLPFLARDRLVETYFWGLGLSYEPKYTSARKMYVQVFQLGTIMDDIYDSYGIMEELSIFKDAIERWERSCINDLPKYMQPCYKAILDTFEGFVHDLEPSGRSKYVAYVKDLMIDQCRLYYQEARWCREKYNPTYEEYMTQLAIASSGTILLMLTFCLGVEEMKDEAFEWFLRDPQVVKDVCTIFRLLNDVAGHAQEQERNHHLPSSVEIYMKQYGATEQEACDELLKPLENYWKDFNEMMMRPYVMPKPALTTILNMSRILEVIYNKRGDTYVVSNNVMKNNITLILSDPIPI